MSDGSVGIFKAEFPRINKKKFNGTVEDDPAMHACSFQSAGAGGYKTTVHNFLNKDYLA